MSQAGTVNFVRNCSLFYLACLNKNLEKQKVNLELQSQYVKWQNFYLAVMQTNVSKFLGLLVAIRMIASALWAIARMFLEGFLEENLLPKSEIWGTVQSRVGHRARSAIALWTALFGSIALLVIGCQNLPFASVSSAPTAVTIKLGGWTASPAEQKLLKELLQDFEAKHPNIKVRHEVINDQYMDVIKTR